MILIPRFLHRSDTHGFEMLRTLRNECRDAMTHAREYITFIEQEKYRTTYPETVRHYLYLEPGEGPWWEHVVGFSRLEDRDGFVSFTYGIGPWARGKGYGWDVAKHFLMAAGAHLRGDVLVSNKASQHILYDLGVEPVGEPEGGIQKIACVWPPPFVEDLHE